MTEKLSTNTSSKESANNKEKSKDNKENFKNQEAKNFLEISKNLKIDENEAKKIAKLIEE
jgi:hypothetical protein